MFIAPGSHSIGELANAVVMARQLADRPVTLLTSPRFAGYARGSGLDVQEIPRGRRAAPFVRQQSAAPDLAAVILADHHLTSLERIGFTIADLADGAPLICLDSLCLGRAGSRLELAVAQHSIGPELHHWFPPEVRTEPVPDRIPLLRPVPVAGDAPGGVAFDLYGGTLRPARGREAVLASLGIDAGRTVVMTAVSGWASRATTRAHLGAPDRDHDAYAGLRTQWLVELCGRLGRRVTIVSLGGAQTGPRDAGPVEVVNLGGLGMQDFTDLVAAVDLYLCDNFTSGAMARAALLGTPVVALTNEHGIRDHSAFVDDWFTRMERVLPHFDFRYLVNPFGWVRELEPLRAGNPYLDALPQAPAYSLDRQEEICREAIESPRRPARDALIGRLSELPTVAQVLDSALDGVLDRAINDAPDPARPVAGRQSSSPTRKE